MQCDCLEIARHMPVNFVNIAEKKRRQKKLWTRELKWRMKQRLSSRVRLALTLAQVLSLRRGVNHARLTSAHESLPPSHFLTADSPSVQPTRTYHAILINTTRSPRNESHGDGWGKVRGTNEEWVARPHPGTCGGIVREGVGDNVTFTRHWKRGSSHAGRQKRSEVPIRRPSHWQKQPFKTREALPDASRGIM